MAEIERVPLLKPFTLMEKLVTALVARQYSYKEIARRLSISRETARWHADCAAAKIPGELASQCKLTMWFRGATLEMLTGEDRKPLSPSEKLVALAERDREAKEYPSY